MAKDRKIQTAEIFNAALTREPDQRALFLRDACGGDEDLFRRVKQLLEAYVEVKTAVSMSSQQQSSEFLLDSHSILALGERYTDIKVIGQGGMGVVLRARDMELDKVVAIKVLHPSLAGDEHAMERFRNEIRLALEITHKNVCRTYGLERFDGNVLISMEYVDGETLRTLLQRVKGISVPEGIGWAKEICDAVGAAHERKVVHRDLKPENIMLDREGHIKVMDFGIARSIDGPERTSETVIGTPRYMSPEQAQGRTAGPATDIYSLGLVLYELFTGIVRDPAHPKSAREANPYLPEQIDRAIAKCLQDDPQKRFQSVNELADALIRSRPDHLPTRIVSRRYVPLVALGLITILALFTLLIKYWKPYRPTSESPRAAETQKLGPKLPVQPTNTQALPDTMPETGRAIPKPLNSASVKPPQSKAVKISDSSVQGAWSATISDAKVSAALQFNIFQNSDRDIVGTYTTSLGGGGSVKGNFKDGVLTFELTQSLQNCPGIFKGAATIHGNKGTGTYAGADCQGDHGTGTVTLSKDFKVLADREQMQKGLLLYLDSKLLVWKEKDARAIMGEPRFHRYGYDDFHNIISDIYTFADPTLQAHHVELGFDTKTNLLTNVFLYPSRGTWAEVKQVFGDNVTTKTNPDGTKFHSYKDRRINIYLDKDDNVINIGLYPATTQLGLPPQRQ